MSRATIVTPTTSARQARLGARVALAGACIVAVLAQTNPSLPLGGALPRPDWTLLVAVAWGYTVGCRGGLLVAWLGGVALDLASGGPFGLHMLAYSLAVLVVARADGPFAGGTLSRVGGVLVAATIVHGVGLVVLQLSGWDVWWSAALIQAVLPTLAADALLLPIVYLALARLGPTPAEHQPRGSESA